MTPEGMYNTKTEWDKLISEEASSEDIENEIERFAYSLPHSADGFWPKDIDCYSQEARTKYVIRHAWDYEKVMVIARHFAEWQKQKMMKNAVVAEVMYPASSSTLQVRYRLPKDTTLKYRDKVKIIIIREEK